MGVVTMTIDGTDVLSYLQHDSLEIDQAINNRPSLKAALVARDGDSYRAPVNKDVIVTDDGTRVFGGVLYTLHETSVVDYRHRHMDIDAVGYEVYADKTVINGILASDTLKNQLTAVVQRIQHGMAVDSGQATGPTLAAQGFGFSSTRQAIEQLSVISGYIYKFDFFKKVKMFSAGSVGAPFALDDTNSTISAMDVQNGIQDYINSVWAQFGSTTQQQVTVTLHGDGSTRLFPLGYVAAAAPTTVTLNGVVKTVGIYGTDSHPPYDYFYRQDDPAYPYSIIQDASQTALTSGDNLVVTFTAQFPGAVYVEDSAEVTAQGPFTLVLSYSDVYDKTVATALAQGELDRRTGITRTITAKTFTAGLEPGMTVNVTCTKRGLSSVDFLITSVKMKHETKKRDGTHLFSYEIEGVEGNRYQANWTQYFRGLASIGGGSSGGTIAGSGGVVTTVTNVPFAFWGGSRNAGKFANATFVDVTDYMPIRITGNGQPITVRVFQATDNAGTSVQTRIVKRVSGVDTAMATSATSTSVRPTFSEQLLTFTPDAGTNDYILQLKGSNGNAAVFAIAMSL